MQQPIGVFDSGYGGLTVLKELVGRLPRYDYIYLGDNARAPYGNRSFETVYQYTLQSVEWLFGQGCPLVVLACNTASAKALRTIQQLDLPRIAPDNRVLGVIRPTTEVVGRYSRSGKLGVLATRGTVLSESYPIEIAKFFPDTEVYQQPCPLWVPLIENNEHNKPGADYFVKAYTTQLMARCAEIDTVVLACTHYPLLKDKIAACLPAGSTLISQGEIVADSLADYLQRHPEMESRLSRNGQVRFYTTDSTEDFDSHASIFYGQNLRSTHVQLDEVQ
ncbi:glutamate racemase [Puia sp.]|jgi:glutamate racemase|uniref:glutamate racemase n=1 Tax=Puia sp. TaxID=2045100 RepID=UPI002F429D31